MAAFDDIPLICPVCGGTLMRRESGVVCGENHAFDRARQGYLNLYMGKTGGIYDRLLWNARRTVCEAGFFTSVTGSVAELLAAHLRQSAHAFMLDAGCGEGTLTYMLRQRLVAAGIGLRAAGIDLSKPGVRMAASRYADICFCVADIGRAPFLSHSADAIVNILSPASYTEFERILRTDGLLVKAVPGRTHLRELRLAAGLEESGAAGDSALTHFMRRYKDCITRELCYSLPAGIYAPELLRMSPFAQGLSEPAAERAAAYTGRVTFHLHVLAAVPRASL